MKKLFTLFAAAIVAVSANAQTYLVAFGVDGVENKGYAIAGTTDDTRQVTLQDGTKLDALSFNNNWSATADNCINLSTDGGFKAGDVVAFKGAISNTDESKRGACEVFVVVDDAKSVLYKSEPDFVNLALNPTNTLEEYKYTLEADYPTLKLGRNGNTRTQLVYIAVTRSGAAGVEAITVAEENAPMYNLQGVQVDENYKGVVIKNGKKFINR